jgi:hypothetical protein
LRDFQKPLIDRRWQLRSRRETKRSPLRVRELVVDQSATGEGRDDERNDETGDPLEGVQPDLTGGEQYATGGGDTEVVAGPGVFGFGLGFEVLVQ